MQPPTAAALAAAAGGGEPARDRWGSRYQFLLASIAAAVGLGNIWRFPYLCFSYGGGAFLIPYLLCMALIGAPILLFELSLGRHFQRGDAEAMGGVHRRLRGTGLASVLAGFLVVTYYSAILAWSLIFMVASFKTPLPWTQQHGGDEGGGGPADSPATRFFYDFVLQRGSQGDLEAASAKSMSGMVFGALLFTWTCVFFSIWKGVQSTGWIVQVTMPAPILLLVVILCYNASLPGAGEGLKAFMGTWDMTALRDPSIWSAACGQVFFSVGVATGIMAAFGSYLPSSSPLVVDHLIICAADALISILAGMTVYTSLGNLARSRGTSIQEEGASAGIGLAFVTYPQSLATLPKHVGNLLGVLFFGAVFFLGIDSAFALVEGVATVVHDTPRFRHLQRSTVCCAVTALGFIFSTVYACSLGTYILDAVDHYVNMYGLVLVTFIKVVGLGWAFGWQQLVDQTGRASALLLTGGYGVAVAIMLALGAGLSQVFQGAATSIGVGVPLAVATTCSSFGLAFAARQGSARGLPFLPWLRAVGLVGPDRLRHSVNACALAHGTARLPAAWSFLMKYILAAVLPALLVSAAFADATQFEAGYGDLPGWLQAVGIICLMSLLLCCTVFLLAPSWWEHTAGEDHVVPLAGSSCSSGSIASLLDDDFAGAAGGPAAAGGSKGSRAPPHAKPALLPLTTAAAALRQQRHESVHVQLQPLKLLRPEEQEGRGGATGPRASGGRADAAAAAAAGAAEGGLTTGAAAAAEAAAAPPAAGAVGAHTRSARPS